MIKKFGFVLFFVLALYGCSGDSAYPNRDITMIIPFGQGGGVDAWGRKIADGLSKEMGANVVPSNVIGGSAGSVGVAKVWDSPHDGYTICATSETPLTIPVLTSFDKTAKDWKYFIAAGSPGVFCINAKRAEALGIKSIVNFANYADKANLKIAGTSGGLWFALASLLTSEQYGNWSMRWVSYSGSGDAIMAAVGGTDADLVVASMGEVADYIRSGDLIVLANMDSVSYGGDIPAITTILPSLTQYFPLRQWVGFKVPSDTPTEIISALDVAFKNVMHTPDIEEFAKAQSAEIFSLSGAEAQVMAEKSESSLSWILSDLGQTASEPSSVGISK